MPFLSDMGLLAAKLEAVEGTAENPAASDAVMVYDISYKLSVNMEQRNPARQHVSGYSAIPGGRSATVKFKTLLKGSGVAGTAPEFNTLLKMCKLVETNVAGVVNIYDVVASGDSSGTIAIYINDTPSSGKKYILTGCRGTWHMSFDNGKPMYIEWEFSGADWTESDSAPLTGMNYDSTLPLIFQGATFTIDGVTAEVSKLSLAAGNKVVPRRDVSKSSGILSYFITSVEPTGAVDPLDRKVATYDLLGKLRAAAEMTLSFRIGSTAGNIVNIYCQNVQYIDVTPGARDNMRTMETNLQLNRNAQTGSINAFADAGGGKVTVTSSSTHGLGNGAHVTITGTTNYNGDFIVSNVTTNTFDIVDTWVSDDASGAWDAGESHINISFE